MSGSRWIDTALGLYPPWWRARYGEEVRTVASDAITGGHSPFRVTAGLVIGAVRTRVSGSTPRQFPLWASRTRALIIFTTVPAFLMVPLFFLTFRQGQRNGLPLVPSASLTRSGHVAYDAFMVLAIAGLLVTGVVIGAYVGLVGVAGRRHAGEHGTHHMALKVPLSAGLVAAAAVEGAVALFVLVAVGFSVWGSVVVRRLKQGGAHHRLLAHLAPVPVVTALLAGVGWVSSEIVGPHQFLDRHGVDVPLDGHTGLAHGLVIGAAAALSVGWLVTFVLLILVIGRTPVSKQEMRSARIVSVAGCRAAVGHGRCGADFGRRPGRPGCSPPAGDDHGDDVVGSPVDGRRAEPASFCSGVNVGCRRLLAIVEGGITARRLNRCRRICRCSILLSSTNTRPTSSRCKQRRRVGPGCQGSAVTTTGIRRYRVQDQPLSIRQGSGVVLPILWGRQGSNLRPRDYESPALTTELLPLAGVLTNFSLAVFTKFHSLITCRSAIAATAI